MSPSIKFNRCIDITFKLEGMKTILHITSSPRGSNSYSTNLGEAIITQLKTQYQEAVVTTWNLATDHPPLYNTEMINGFYSSPEFPDYNNLESLTYANQVLSQVKKADIIIISTPTYNLSISAHLKAWIDQLIRPGVTYTYDNTGQRIGLVTDKKVYLAIASGGKVGTSHQLNDYISGYIKDVFKVYVGITDVTTYRIEGTAFPNFTPDYDTILTTFKN